MFLVFTNVGSLKVLTKIDESNYPEILGGLVVINAPALFPLIYKMLTPFIDPVVLSKVKVCKCDWEPVVSEFCDMTCIPAEWGGKSDLKWVKRGSDLEQDEDDQSDVNIVAVKAQTKEYVEFEVDQEGSSIFFSFTTESHDIAFGVVRMDKKEKELHKIKRVDSHVEPVTGVVAALKKGKHAMVFDNSYSWATSKEISLFYKLRPPMTRAQKKREKKKNKIKKK